MSLQYIAVGVTIGLTVVATVVYNLIYQRRRHVSNNPNAIRENFDVFRNSECSICLEALEEADRAILNCGHELHRDCLSRLGRCRGYSPAIRCPICRTPIRFE